VEIDGFVYGFGRSDPAARHVTAVYPEQKLYLPRLVIPEHPARMRREEDTIED